MGMKMMRYTRLKVATLEWMQMNQLMNLVTEFCKSYVVLKSAQLLLAEDVEEEVCPGAGGGVVIGCWAEVGVAEAVARRLIGASLSGIRSA